MKFVLEAGNKILIHAYDEGSISVKGIRPDSPQVSDSTLDEWDRENQLGIIRSSVLISSSGSISPWAASRPAELTPGDMLLIAETQPEVVLIGTGKTLQFPAADCIATLQQQNLGYEIMDTAAACRTFNVLVSEGRTVTLAVMMIE